MCSRLSAADRVHWHITPVLTFHVSFLSVSLFHTQVHSLPKNNFLTGGGDWVLRDLSLVLPSGRGYICKICLSLKKANGHRRSIEERTSLFLELVL
jgi:hypothetical protein